MTSVDVETRIGSGEDPGASNIGLTGLSGRFLLQYRLARRGWKSAIGPVRRSGRAYLIAHQAAGGDAITFLTNTVESGSATGRTCDWLVASPGESVDGAVRDVDYLALVDLTSERVWLLNAEEVAQVSSLQDDDSRRIYTYSVPTFDAEKTGHLVFSAEFDRYLLEARI